MIDPQRLELLLSTATSMGLNPKVITDRGLVSIEVNGKQRYIFHKVSNPNGQMASWLSQNKYISRVIFEKNGIPNIPFCLANSLSEAQDFLSKHESIIVKPIKGEKSKDIYLISSPAELKEVDLNKNILEKFIKGQEVRFLVVAGEVKSVHYKVYKGDINDPKTVKRISIKKGDWNKEIMPFALKAAEVIGLKFAAIDFLIKEDGQFFILEINSAPGLERFQKPDQGPRLDAMRLYLEQIVLNYE